MSTAASVRLRRRTPLAACLYAALALEALHSSPLLATTRLVANCNNSGTGSLRGVVGLSASNDTVSLASLGTCTITLATASVSVGVTNLTITGPSSNTVTISGDQLYRVFNHTGTGTLTLQHLVVSDGKYNTANGKGGCVKSAGSVTLQSSTMTNCNVKPVSGIARGGAIYAHGKVTLTNSTLTGNIAQGTGGAYGGAVLAGSIDTENSVISGNMAQIPDGDYADSTSVRVEGGALWTSGAMTSNNSIIHSNAAIGPNTKGGCVLGKGTMYLGATTISNCNSYANYISQGGGIYAAAALTLAHSTISNNVAGGDDGTYGGGLRAGSVTVRYSTIHGNYLGNGPHGFGGHANGGGMFVYQGATIVSNSTIDANGAGGTGGGIFGFHSNIAISNSTISGNIADGDGDIVSTAGGGIAMQATAGTAATLMISNSTIAFNQAYTDFGAYGGAGVRAYGTAVIQSSIIANNLKHGQPDDFSCECGIAASPTISGSNNLIIALDPAGTPPPFNFVTRTTDPKLTPLSLHGGETAVHALNPSSPAVGNGNNVGSFTYDQRGFGFTRNVGGATDIGAYERQPIDDEIFYDAFGH